MDFFAHFARRFFENGLNVLPLIPNSKQPCGGTSGFNKFAERRQTEEELERYLKLAPKGAGLAIVCSPSTVTLLDVDTNDPEVRRRLPTTPCEVRGAKGGKLAFRTPWATHKLTAQRPNTFDPENGKAIEKLELLCYGGYGAYLGIHPDTERPYEIVGQSLADYPLDEIPVLTQEEWEDLKAWFEKDVEPGSATRGADLSAVLVHPDGSRTPHGSHDQMKTYACKMIAKGTPVDQAVKELLDYDLRHHKPLAYFWDQTRSDTRGLDPVSAAYKYYGNMLAFVNSTRKRAGKDLQLPQLAAEGATEEAPAEELMRNKEGRVIANLYNVALLIRTENVYKEFWYDSFYQRIRCKDGAATREWGEYDDTALSIQIQQRFGLPTVKSNLVSEVVRLVAKDRERHGPRDWFDTLKWDGEARIERCFAEYFGAEDTEYSRAASRNFWISMVARIYRPGCKVDNMVVLEGNQGRGKSSALDLIGGGLFMEASEVLGTKDFLQHLSGKLIVEIAELEGFGRAGTKAIKKTVSCRSDRYRASYDRYARDYPRQCIFVGTTNEDEYLEDPTGGRRFWPVMVKKIDLAGLAAARSQLFAEAVAMLQAGATWWEMPETAAEEQEARYRGDAWSEAIEDWLCAQEGPVTTIEVASNALGLEVARVDAVTQKRIGAVMRKAGWRRTTARMGPEKRVTKVWARGDGAEAQRQGHAPTVTKLAREAAGLTSKSGYNAARTRLYAERHSD